MINTQTRLRTALLAVPMLAALAWWAWPRESRPDDPNRADAPSAVATSSASKTDPAIAVKRPTAETAAAPRPGFTPAANLPLPGPMPPAQLVSVLEPRAKAGDRRAACRLATELARCRMALHWKLRTASELDRDIEQMRKRGSMKPEAIAQVRRQYEQNNLRRQQCEAVPSDLRDAAPRFFLQAAMQGSVSSMVGFANAEGVGGAEIVADPGYYQQYRAHAFPLWQQAMQQGSVDAIRVWYYALQSNGIHFFVGVLPEEFRDVQLSMAMMAEVETAIGIIPTSVDAQLNSVPADTRARAHALFERHYAGSVELRRSAAAMAEARATALAAVARKQGEASFTPADEDALAETDNERCSF